MSLTVDERFDAKVEPEPMSGCHLWMGYISPEGYGTFRGGDSRLAHRYAYERAKGPIPEGLVIDHMCRNRCCVNPSHLRAVTRYQNVHENSDAQAYHKKRQTHCIHGHEFTLENTYYHGPKGRYRQCRKCHLRHSRNWHEKQRR